MLREMDTDAVIARHPQVALVDELAHTNVPGSKHEKRYEDVMELLDGGMTVRTLCSCSSSSRSYRLSGATWYTLSPASGPIWTLPC